MVQHWLNDTDRPSNRPREVVGVQLYAFFNLGARSTLRPGRFTPKKDPVPTVQEAGWAPGQVWGGVGAENLDPARIRFLDRPAGS